MRLGHTHDQIKIERRPWRVSLRVWNLSKGFHVVRGRSEHPILWRVQNLKMKSIPTFCNETLLLWGLFIISKSVLRRVLRHDLGRVHSRGTGILWPAPRRGRPDWSTFKRRSRSRGWIYMLCMKIQLTRGQFPNCPFFMPFTSWSCIIRIWEIFNSPKQKRPPWSICFS